MTNFAYTTGNPNNLTAGASASMNDIQGPFTDLRTFINGANLSDTNLQAAGTSLSKLVPLILYGTVAGLTGAISNAGSGGWTSSRSATGTYAVTFSPTFSVAPVFLPGLQVVGGQVGITIPSISTTAAGVVTFNTSTNATVDANFFFMAIGVR